MRRRWTRWCLVSAVLLVAPATARATERSEVPERFKWDLTALYRSESAWTAAKADLEKRIPRFARFRGHLTGSADSLKRGLDEYEALHRELARLGTYASQLADEDVRIARHVGMREAANQLQVKFGAASAFVRPEILAAGATRIRGLLASDPRLSSYRMFLEDLLRYAPHTLTSEEEKIAAQAGVMANAGASVRDDEAAIRPCWSTLANGRLSTPPGV